MDNNPTHGMWHMKLQKSCLIVLGVCGIVVVISAGWLAVKFFDLYRYSPAMQYAEARQLWGFNSLAHYRMAVGFWSDSAQCYYDIEVLQDRIIHIHTFTCLGNSASKTLTVDGIFETFERFATETICSPNGCYCEGNYVVQATYDTALGYPRKITTAFARNSLTDLWHGKWRVQECLIRTNLTIDKFEIMRVDRLP